MRRCRGRRQSLCESKEAARGFRRCVQLEYDNFEAWANLSNAELKAGNRDAALRTLLESIKCNFEKWELWFNLVTIATDLGDFNSSIRAYTKLMELKPEKDYTDEPVLAVLQQAINDNVEDYQGNKARNHLLLLHMDLVSTMEVSLILVIIWM